MDDNTTETSQSPVKNGEKEKSKTSDDRVEIPVPWSTNPFVISGRSTSLLTLIIGVTLGLGLIGTAVYTNRPQPFTEALSNNVIGTVLAKTPTQTASPTPSPTSNVTPTPREIEITVEVTREVTRQVIEPVTPQVVVQTVEVTRQATVIVTPTPMPVPALLADRIGNAFSDAQNFLITRDPASLSDLWGNKGSITSDVERLRGSFISIESAKWTVEDLEITKKDESVEVYTLSVKTVLEIKGTVECMNNRTNNIFNLIFAGVIRAEIQSGNNAQWVKIYSWTPDHQTTLYEQLCKSSAP